MAPDAPRVLSRAVGSAFSDAIARVTGRGDVCDWDLVRLAETGDGDTPTRVGASTGSIHSRAARPRRS
ncbi:MAG: hypothetical protein M3011_08095 [Actinomycetota bacterium]|nr:hypothetical protein [Actinomycetota bacterium]